jgi:hypothetical protein
MATTFAIEHFSIRAVIPGKPHGGADPGSIGGLRSAAMDPGSPLRGVQDDGEYVFASEGLQP